MPQPKDEMHFDNPPRKEFKGILNLILNDQSIIDMAKQPKVEINTKEDAINALQAFYDAIPESVRK